MWSGIASKSQKDRVGNTSTLQQVTPPTEEEREQAKQEYLALLLGDQA